MLKKCRSIFADESGLMSSAEYMFLAVIVAFGAIVGLATFRDQLVQEYGDTGVALENLNQSYIYVVPGPGYDPNVPYDPMNPVGYHVSIYNADVEEPAPPTDPPGAAPGGIMFTNNFTQEN